MAMVPSSAHSASPRHLTPPQIHGTPDEPRSRSVSEEQGSYHADHAITNRPVLGANAFQLQAIERNQRMLQSNAFYQAAWRAGQVEPGTLDQRHIHPALRDPPVIYSSPEEDAAWLASGFAVPEPPPLLTELAPRIRGQTSRPTLGASISSVSATYHDQKLLSLTNRCSQSRALASR